jgi:lipoprotein-anchoring transpeptidase ErfK/SrfK
MRLLPMAAPSVIIRAGQQEAHLYQGADLVRAYKVSTARNGLGCEVRGNKTPMGLLRVARKIGGGCATGTVFRKRMPTGEIWTPDRHNVLWNSQEDLILTRILWLMGCEAHNSSTFGRYIYLHGTNSEHLLGTAASRGCIRFSNKDIEELFDLVPEGTFVRVIE